MFRALQPLRIVTFKSSLSINAVQINTKRWNSTSEVSSSVAEKAVELVSAGGPISEIHQFGFGSLYSPVGFVEQVLESIHVYADIPWWASIVVFTVGLRTMLFPIAVKQAKLAAIQQKLRPELIKFQASIQEYKDRGQLELAQNESARHSKFLISHGCNPLRQLSYGFMPLPFYVSTFLAIRQLLGAPIPSMVSGGIAWFPNLTITDPYYILPLLAVAALSANLEYSQKHAPISPNPTMKTAMRVIALVSIPLLATLPSGMCLYFMSTNFLTLFQSVVLRIPLIRKLLGLDELGTAIETSSAVEIKQEGLNLGPVKNAKVPSTKIIGNPWDAYVQPAPTFIPKKRNKA